MSYTVDKARVGDLRLHLSEDLEALPGAGRFTAVLYFDYVEVDATTFAAGTSREDAWQAALRWAHAFSHADVRDRLQAKIDEDTAELLDLAARVTAMRRTLEKL